MFNENESTTYGKCGLKSGMKKQKPGTLTEGQRLGVVLHREVGNIFGCIRVI